MHKNCNCARQPWDCARCSKENFRWRHACRNCREPPPPPLPDGPPPAAAADPPPPPPPKAPPPMVPLAGWNNPSSGSDHWIGHLNGQETRGAAEDRIALQLAIGESKGASMATGCQEQAAVVAAWPSGQTSGRDSARVFPATVGGASIDDTVGIADWPRPDGVQEASGTHGQSAMKACCYCGDVTHPQPSCSWCAGALCSRRCMQLHTRVCQVGPDGDDPEYLPVTACCDPRTQPDAPPPKPPPPMAPPAGAAEHWIGQALQQHFTALQDLEPPRLPPKAPPPPVQLCTPRKQWLQQFALRMFNTPRSQRHALAAVMQEEYNKQFPPMWATKRQSQRSVAWHTSSRNQQDAWCPRGHDQAACS